jgi:hypothetical protein
VLLFSISTRLQRRFTHAQYHFPLTNTNTNLVYETKQPDEDPARAAFFDLYAAAAARYAPLFGVDDDVFAKMSAKAFYNYDAVRMFVHATSQVREKIRMCSFLLVCFFSLLSTTM